MKRFSGSSAIKGALIGALVLGVPACTPIVKNHGYILNEEDLKQLETGKQNQTQVRQLMGSPSTVANFNGETWFYINSTLSLYAWQKPEVIHRKVVAIKFDNETKQIASINNYGLEDGRVIDFVTRETPTKGRELTFLEQLLGNVGRQSADQFDDEAQRRR